MASTPEPPTIFAEVRYRDARTAIALLRDVFGFEERLVVEGDDGGVVHAELTYGNGLVMLGSADEVQGLDTPVTGAACLCVVVDDPDWLHDRVVAAGVEVTMALQDTSYGARSFAARDHEGNHWVFSDYQPFAVDSSSSS